CLFVGHDALHHDVCDAWDTTTAYQCCVLTYKEVSGLAYYYYSSMQEASLGTPADTFTPEAQSNPK
ncbi:hypothetical protein Pcinc_036659, partial [Petrolisthes cinctipes]